MKIYIEDEKMLAGSGTLRSLSLATVLSHSDNKRVSGFAPLCPNLPFGQTSDTRRTLGEIIYGDGDVI